MHQHSHDHHHRKKRMFTGFLFGALATLALGIYYFFGPKGREHYQETRRRIYTAKADILDRMENIRDLTEEKYRDIVDTVLSQYVAAKEITREEANKLAERFKRKWRTMQDIAERSKRRAKEEWGDEDEE